MSERRGVDQAGFPGLVLRAPLRRHPVGGAAVGALMGMFFGLLGANAGWEASGEAILAGYSLGGLCGGLLVGLTLPMFRNRAAAGVIVGISAALWAKIAMSFSGESFDLVAAGFTAVLFGVFYGVLLWDYRVSEE